MLSSPQDMPHISGEMSMTLPQPYVDASGMGARRSFARSGKILALLEALPSVDRC